LPQTKAITLKTQQHAVNACRKQLSQLSLINKCDFNWKLWLLCGRKYLIVLLLFNYYDCSFFWASNWILPLKYNCSFCNFFLGHKFDCTLLIRLQFFAFGHLKYMYFKKIYQKEIGWRWLKKSEKSTYRDSFCCSSLGSFSIWFSFIYCPFK